MPTVSFDLTTSAGPSDDYVEVALGHNAMVLADIMSLSCRYYQIERSDVFERIKKLLASINE
jgi:bisphosphoglycerate-independent phosphoglycerate mutase (AlkP superfamily)